MSYELVVQQFILVILILFPIHSCDANKILLFPIPTLYQQVTVARLVCDYVAADSGHAEFKGNARGTHPVTQRLALGYTAIRIKPDAHVGRIRGRADWRLKLVVVAVGAGGAS